MPETYENWLRIVNICVYKFTRHWLTQWISKRPEILENALGKAVLSKCSFRWNKRPVNIWNDRKAQRGLVRWTCKYFFLNFWHCHGNSKGTSACECDRNLLKIYRFARWLTCISSWKAVPWVFDIVDIAGNPMKFKYGGLCVWRVVIWLKAQIKHIAPDFAHVHENPRHTWVYGPWVGWCRAYTWIQRVVWISLRYLEWCMILLNVIDFFCISMTHCRSILPLLCDYSFSQLHHVISTLDMDCN